VAATCSVQSVKLVHCGRQAPRSALRSQASKPEAIRARLPALTGVACHARKMAKPLPRVPVLPTSPMTLVCPYAGHDLGTTAKRHWAGISKSSTSHELRRRRRKMQREKSAREPDKHRQEKRGDSTGGLIDLVFIIYLIVTNPAEHLWLFAA